MTARRLAGIRRYCADPAVRERQAGVLAENISTMSDAERERRRKRGHWLAANVLNRPEVVAKSASPEVRARASKSRSDSMLAWCPPEWRETYRGLVKRGNRAAKAKAMVLGLIDGKPVLLYAEQRNKLAWCPQERRERYASLRKRVGASEARRVVEGEIRAAELGRYDPIAAADFLQRFGPVVRCDADGTLNRRGTHWRRGSTVLTGLDLVERALRNKWQPDAWRRVAA